MLDTVGRYRTAMAAFAGMSDLEVWYSRLEIESSGSRGSGPRTNNRTTARDSSYRAPHAPPTTPTIDLRATLERDRCSRGMR